MFPENDMLGSGSEIGVVSDNLYKASMGADWKEVVKIYAENFGFAQGIKINEFGDTALHLAISNGAPEEIVKKLVDIVVEEDQSIRGALEIENHQGNTPLHLAASMGSLESCIYIAKANRLLGSLRNREGETPLFLAAARGGTDIFFCLHSICFSEDVFPEDVFPENVFGKDEEDEMHDPSCCRKSRSRCRKSLSCCRKRNGETILHCAIQREYWGENFFPFETAH
nr:uncharacterized protein LOC111998167 [Quercus suber]POE68900.1 serine/threonine-protein phosphatase 6 regulatory ankyrin repeat subunit c [Quercus suber]